MAKKCKHRCKGKSALSNSIKELEKSLNGLLFDRNLILNQKGKNKKKATISKYL
ncbi:hypothetical protein CHL_0482 [Campylobacter hyointestinalis subsp. lawsonii CCUG 27631]|nr:hypothetical protein CHL_0482 [Campylobacter hyointestinalis subsp. lawsonii CCUG 27631]